MEFKQVQFKADDVDAEAGLFRGYASTWDLDSGGDVIVKGAFSKTLAEKRSQVKILWQHKTDTPIGKPLEMREDERGLFVEGKISDTTHGKDAKILLKDGVIDRMSIGFIANSDAVTVKDGIRYIEELELFEFSLVTWPMNDAAVITAVKSLRPKDIERVLREAGLTKSQAAALVNKGLPGLREVDQDQGPTEEELKALSDAIGSFYVNTALRG